MTTPSLQGFARPTGQPGARNHVFVLPSVVCSALVAREIAEAADATAVTHQHGCGHIGPDIVQTRQLFVGLASSPNVAHSLVVSLGCETIQGRDIADELERLGHDTRFVGIQDSGGSSAAREAGVREAKALKRSADEISRHSVDSSGLTLGIAVSRYDSRVTELIRHAVDQGARVVIADDGFAPGGLLPGAAEIAVGEVPTAQISVVKNAGSAGSQLLSIASCRAQVVVEFPANDQPPLSIALAPVVSVPERQGLHKLIPGEFDVVAQASVDELWDTVQSVFSGTPAKSEIRNSTTFAIPRLLRTM